MEKLTENKINIAFVPPPGCIWPKEFANIMGVSRYTIYLWKNKGLPCVNGFVDKIKGEEWVKQYHIDVKRRRQEVGRKNIQALNTDMKSVRGKLALARMRKRPFSPTSKREYWNAVFHQLGVNEGCEDAYRVARKKRIPKKEAVRIANDHGARNFE